MSPVVAATVPGHVVAAPLPPHTGAAATGTAPAAAEPVGPNGFLPAPARPTLRLDERQFSRVHASPLSFGPLGRAVISGIVIAPIWFIWFMSGGGLVNLLFTAPTAALPLWYLRQTWARHRIR